jgi:response regulator RpfG family c-di-GMP phosphodiesterase
VSYRGPDAQQLGEEGLFEHPFEIGHARGAAGAALEADNALDRLQMPEAPALEMVFEIDQLLGQLVEIPVILRVAVNRRPGCLDAGVMHVLRRLIAV